MTQWEKDIWKKLYDDTLGGRLEWKRSSEETGWRWRFLSKSRDEILVIMTSKNVLSLMMAGVSLSIFSLNDGSCHTIHSGGSLFRKNTAVKLCYEIEKRFFGDVLEDDIEFFREHGLPGPR